MVLVLNAFLEIDKHKQMKISLLIAVLYIFSSRLLLAQQGELVLKGTEEQRNIGFWPSKLELTTELIGVKVDQSHQISIKEIRAVDNLSNPLEMIAGYPYPRDYFTNQKEIVIGITPPAREAESISVTGVIEYFTVSEALKSELNLTNLQQYYHQNLLKGINGCKLVLIDLRGLSKMQKNDETGYLKKVKEIHQNAGVGDDVDDAKLYLDKAVSDYNYWGGDASKLLHFYREDPNDAVVEVKIWKDGKTLTNGSSNYGDSYSFSIEESLTPEMRMQIIVKTGDAIQEIPFQFVDVRLP